ncbi:MAG TPA: PAS domain S-box protein [Burkholderiales bacterium]|nr:PAS domain S-box protein [Burkholderiales bacterium]
MKSDKRPQGEPAVPNGDALLGSLFAQTAVGIAVISPEGPFLRVNEALCRMLGYAEQELLQKTVRDITHADDLESTQELQLELLAGPGARVHERRYLRKDGSALWVQIAGTSVRDGSGSPQCFVTLVHDITELKLAQDALKTSESRFRRMVELSSDWYWVQDENFRFVELPGVEKRGIDPEAFIGKARWELQGPGSLPEKAWRQHREKLERHEPFSDFVYMTPDNAGEMRYLSVTGEPIFDAQGKFTGYHGIGRDITDKARAQKDLEDSEQRYRMLFDIHPRPMWVVENKTLRFLAVNQAAVDHYGYSREEFLAMTAEQLRPPEDIAQLLKDFQDPSRSYMQRVARHRKKNGEQIDVEIVSFNFAFDGRPARLAVISDVTERLKAEQQARELEERYRALVESRKDPGSRRGS